MGGVMTGAQHRQEVMHSGEFRNSAPSLRIEEDIPAGTAARPSPNIGPRRSDIRHRSSSSPCAAHSALRSRPRCAPPLPRHPQNPGLFHRHLGITCERTVQGMQRRVALPVTGRTWTRTRTAWIHPEASQDPGGGRPTELPTLRELHGCTSQPRPRPRRVPRPTRTAPGGSPAPRSMKGGRQSSSSASRISMRRAGSRPWL